MEPLFQRECGQTYRHNVAIHGELPFRLTFHRGPRHGGRRELLQRMSGTVGGAIDGEVSQIRRSNRPSRVHHSPTPLNAITRNMGARRQRRANIGNILAGEGWPHWRQNKSRIDQTDVPIGRIRMVEEYQFGVDDSALRCPSPSSSRSAAGLAEAQGVELGGGRRRGPRRHAVSLRRPRFGLACWRRAGRRWTPQEADRGDQIANSTSRMLMPERVSSLP